jgi:lysophospholipid acyltransferase (LPLAT)-like uncharacterized protein
LALPLGKRLLARAVGGISTLFHGLTLRHVRHCSRWHLRGPLDAALDRPEPILIAAWHQDVSLLFHYLINRAWFERRRRFVMLASRSFDGEVTERVLGPWGFRFVRGSAGKKGARAALRALRRALDAGQSVLVVADGPLPPPYVMAPGPAYLARATGVPLYVVRTWARPQLIVPATWFRMALPLPRARFAVYSEGPLDVGGRLEDARSRAQAALNRLCEEADADLYLRRMTTGGIRLATRSV